MFIDEVRIDVKAGDGGNGVVAFRREKFVPRGGPAGGDGGRGGDVVLTADSHLTTLVDYKYKRKYKAERGRDGGNNNMTGANGANLVLRVPRGTQVFDSESGELLADLDESGAVFTAAEGGRGGRGNARFAGPVHQTPRFAENGEPGDSISLRLELKLLADAGIIGFPNVGKSTLIAQVSAAKPRIADYPFTTLIPNLGVVRTSDENSFVMADIPGLIEGAHTGSGLGIRFLRHIERTRLLLHILDVSGFTARNPLEDFEAVNRELGLYSEKLAGLPQFVALNKIDVPGAKEIASEITPVLEKKGYEVFIISAATGEGVRQLIDYIGSKLKEIEVAPVASEKNEVVRIAPDAKDPRQYEIEKVAENEYEVRGKGIERMIAMTKLDNDETLRRLHRKLERIGILKAIKDAGVVHGDTVRIGTFEFDYSSDDELE